MDTTDREKWKIPLVIGVCGHRDLATPEEEIAEKLADIWKCLRERFPNTPFLVLDSLAEGADASF